MIRIVRPAALLGAALALTLTLLAPAGPTSAARTSSTAVASAQQAASYPTYVTGRIVNRRGNPVKGVYIAVRNATRDVLLGGPVRTGRYGYFRINGITEEEIAIRVNGWSVGYERGWVTCSPNRVAPWSGACTKVPGNHGRIVIDRR